MKKLTFLFAFLFVTSLAMAQVPTLHDPNATVTVTSEQIKAWGLASLQNASTIAYLDFEGLGDEQIIGNYYNGGAGPNYGVEFSGAALALIDADAGGSGNFANEPSPNTIMFFLTANPYMNVAAGFTTGFSFYYCSSGTTTVNVYDGLNGTGNLLGTFNFTANYNVNCTGDPSGAFCRWDPVGVAFAGTAKSVQFIGGTNQTGFDDITFGSVTPGPGPTIPTLSEWGLIILGLTLLGFGTFYIVRMRG